MHIYLNPQPLTALPLGASGVHISVDYYFTCRTINLYEESILSLQIYSAEIQIMF